MYHTPRNVGDGGGAGGGGGGGTGGGGAAMRFNGSIAGFWFSGSRASAIICGSFIRSSFIYSFILFLYFLLYPP